MISRLPLLLSELPSLNAHHAAMTFMTPSLPYTPTSLLLFLGTLCQFPLLPLHWSLWKKPSLHVLSRLPARRLPKFRFQRSFPLSLPPFLFRHFHFSCVAAHSLRAAVAREGLVTLPPPFVSGFFPPYPFVSRPSPLSFPLSRFLYPIHQTKKGPFHSDQSLVPRWASFSTWLLPPINGSPCFFPLSLLSSRSSHSKYVLLRKGALSLHPLSPSSHLSLLRHQISSCVIESCDPYMSPPFPTPAQSRNCGCSSAQPTQHQSRFPRPPAAVFPPTLPLPNNHHQTSFFFSPPLSPTLIFRDPSYS